MKDIVFIIVAVVVVVVAVVVVVVVVVAVVVVVVALVVMVVAVAVAVVVATSILTAKNLQAETLSSASSCLSPSPKPWTKQQDACLPFRCRQCSRCAEV